MLEELLPDFFDLKRNFLSSCLLNWTDPDIEDNPDKIEEASEPVLNDEVLRKQSINLGEISNDKERETQNRNSGIFFRGNGFDQKYC